MPGLLEIMNGLRIPENELSFEFARSGGPGGQNVNKVATRAELLFDVDASPSLTPEQKSVLRLALRNRIGSDGVLRLRSEGSRSQWKNRQEVLRKFSLLLAHALRPSKRRLSSGPTGGSRARRLASKRKKSAVKQMRRRVPPEV